MIQLYYEGKLPVGEATFFGLDSDGMGLAMDEYLRRICKRFSTGRT